VAEVPDQSEGSQVLLQRGNSLGEPPPLITDLLHYCLHMSLVMCKDINYYLMNRIRYTPSGNNASLNSRENVKEFTVASIRLY